MAGLSETGLTIKSLSEIQASIRQKITDRLGVTINTDEDSVIAQIIDPAADEISDLWLAIQSVYNSQDPDTATSESLDRLANQVGITRLPATKSFVVNQQFTGDNNTLVPAGSLIEVDGTEERFTNDSSVTISASDTVQIVAEVSTVSNNTSYEVSVDGTVYQITSDGDATNLEIAAALVGAVNGGILPVTATDNLDGTFSIAPDVATTPINTSFGPGLTITSVTTLGFLEAVNFGVVQAPAGTLSNIVTPVVGWVSTTNGLDATLGRELETDAELRVRRNQSLAVTGESTVPAIRAKLAQLADVEAAIVIENDLETPDGEGRPPHSFESIVLGGLDADIAETIWENKPAGIQTFGSTQVTHIDDEGIARLINFSRPTEIYLHVRVSYTKYSEEAFPSVNGETSILQTVLDTGNALTIGNDVLPERFKGPIFTNVSGIAELTIEVATSAGPLDPPGAYQTTPLAIGGTELSVFDSSRIIVQEV